MKIVEAELKHTSDVSTKAEKTSENPWDSFDRRKWKEFPRWDIAKMEVDEKENLEKILKVLYKPNDDKLKEYLYFDTETARICTVYQIRKARKRLTNVDAFDYCKFASEQYTNEILQNI